mgnify:FL=1
MLGGIGEQPRKLAIRLHFLKIGVIFDLYHVTSKPFHGAIA